MKLYGAEVTQKYIEYKDGKKRHIRYPRSKEYPWEAKNQVAKNATRSLK